MAHQLTPDRTHPAPGGEGETETAPRRVQRRRTAGWTMPANTVYVGRPTRWGNPFRAGETWRHDEDGAALRVRDNAHAVELFALHTGPLGDNEYGAETLAELRRQLGGRNLACWCPLDVPCHADVLLELANRRT